MRIFRFTSFFVVGSFLLIGCGNNSSSNSNIQEGATGGSLIVNVSPGNSTSQPFYSWEDSTLNPTAATISVARTSDLSTPVWGVTSNPPDQNLIPSPWEQGSSTALITETASTERTLETNITYRVTITKGNGTTDGWREFTIMP